MIHFEWPWLFLALPLPWLIRVVVPPREPVQEAALRVPFLEDFSQSVTEERQKYRFQWLFLIGLVAWILLVTASARPQWLGEVIEMPVSGRDLMLAVDLSGSMQEQDFIIKGKQIDRLSATKLIARDFIERRVGDRLGLILFGEQAYLQTPLTFDRVTVNTLLYEAVIGLAGKATAIGDAIGLAVKHFREQTDSNRVLILLTDGVNTAGAVDPIAAAEFAAQQGVKIYTIGIGADEMIVRGLFGSRYKRNPSRDLNETALKTIAKKTGGQYFRARDTEELKEIYKLLDELEPIEQDSLQFRPRAALYPWPLAISLAIAGLLLIMRISGRILI